MLRDRWFVFVSRWACHLLLLIGMPVVRIVQLADGEELVTVELDQGFSHVVDDPRDELLRHRHTAKASTGPAGTMPGWFRGIGGAQFSGYSQGALVSPFSLPRLRSASLGIHPEADGPRDVRIEPQRTISPHDDRVPVANLLVG